MSINKYILPREGLRDVCQTGFYSVKNSNTLHLRIQESKHNIEGIIRLNKSNKNEYVFEGYNGSKWVQFNAKQGEKGDTGNNFSNLFKFENCLESCSKLNYNNNNSGFIFKTLELNEDNSKNNLQDKTVIEVRSLSSNYFTINNIKFKSIDIKTKDKEILLNPLPQPFNWDFTNLNIKNMKSDDMDERFKAYGDVSKWSVKPNEQIYKGQAVRLINNNNQLQVIPLTYSPSINLNLFNNPKEFLGIALEDSSGKDNIDVCTKGITTIRCNIDESFISNEFMTNIHINQIGLSGIVSGCGFIFNSPIKPLNDFVKAGYFLETGKITENTNYFLFFIEK